ncbi:MAG: hypothetical protein CFE34_19135 [Rhodobacteraceae bacterium PARR1]|nr:MAG: hypothetical protein CFE34_19135 [Rhodobacteraceae bacterium PARR1]
MRLGVTHKTGEMREKVPPAARPAVPHVKVMFADGTQVWVRQGKAADYIFSPVILKNTFINLLVYGLLVWRSDFSGLDVWQIVTVWMGISVGVLLWLYLATVVVTFLVQARVIGFVFTPFFTLPIVLVSETTTQLILMALTGEPLVSVGSVLHFVIRDLLVVLLFDIQFGNFVAPHHPMMMTHDPDAPAIAGPDAVPDTVQDTAPDTVRVAMPVALSQAIQADPRTRAVVTVPPPIGAEFRTNQGSETQTAPAEPGPPRTTATEATTAATLTIGGEVVRIADLVSVHAEDHYIRVQMRDSRLLLRGRFSDVVAKLGAGTGIQVTRSDWISRPHVTAIQRTEDYKLFVLTSDQQTLPVARARKVDVMGFARQHDIPVTRRR